jgi:hypothetical protein
LILVSMNEQIESGKSKKYFFHKWKRNIYLIFKFCHKN